MQKGHMCFFIQWHLEPFCTHHSICNFLHCTFVICISINSRGTLVAGLKSQLNLLIFSFSSILTNWFLSQVSDTVSSQLSCFTLSNNTIPLLYILILLQSINTNTGGGSEVQPRMESTMYHTLHQT